MYVIQSMAVVPTTGGDGHDVRPTCASLLWVQRSDIKRIPETFGHSTISITADVYTRTRGGTRRVIADRMDEALGT